MEFVASLVGSLAWPLAVVGAVVLLRKQLAAAFRDRAVEAFELGPGGIKLSLVDRVLKDAGAAITSASVSADQPAQLGEHAASRDRDELHQLAAISPNAAILDAFARVERALSAVVDRGPGAGFLPARRLAQLAVEQRWLSPEVAVSVEDLSRLRNAVAHGEGYVTREQAETFVDLAVALLVLLRGDPPLR